MNERFTGHGPEWLGAMLAVWLWTPVAWTWYVFVGASMTVVEAWIFSFVLSPRNPQS